MFRPDPESHLLVRALAEFGVESSMVAWDDDFDWGSVPLVVCRTPWDYFERVDAFLAWARAVASVTRLENSAQLLGWNAHKRYLIGLQQAGVPIVPTTILTRHASRADRRAAVEGLTDIVVKPAVSVGAFGALRAGPKEAAPHLDRLLELGDALIQPFISAVQSSGEISVVCFGGKVSHAVRKTPAAGDYRVHEHLGGTVEVLRPTAEQTRLACSVLELVADRPAYARIDLVQTEEGPLLMEAELIEPELFLRHDPHAATRFARELVERVASL